MNADQWKEVETLFAELVELDPDLRSARLSAIRDAAVCQELSSLLKYAGGPVEEVDAAIGAVAEQAEAATFQNQRFGPYRVVGRLGQGGQGAVFEAIRDDGSFQQRVAIKIVKWEIDSETSRARFRQERQILAGLEHPNIARLLDGGQREDGTPYLVMEFIEGQPLTEAVQGWSTRRKLELFCKLMEAVEFAHRNLIVHRDLKPANLVVTRDGTPKLLDFGIAKLLDSEAQRTMTMVQALTPQYASPEQVRGEFITTASDIYSLGVVLYELLTGRRPYRIDTVTPLELDRVVCQGEPAPPGLGDELDHILLMALRKEPERRYHTVEQFADDIQRYLDHRPVKARPDALWYRTRKYVRRHWIGLLAASIAAVGVSGGAGVAVYEARRAERQFNQVRELANRFLFDFHDEIATIPGTVKAREMIASTALDYLNRLSKEASHDFGLQWELAVAFGKLALLQGSASGPSLRRPHDAMASFERAFALARPLADRRILNTKQQETFLNMLCDAESVSRVGDDYDTAIRLGKEAIDRSQGLSTFAQGRPLGEMAITLGYTSDLTGSVSYTERLIPVSRENARLDPTFQNRRRLAEALDNYGNTNRKLTEFEQALTVETEALGLFRALAAETPNDPRSRRQVLVALVHLGDATGASDEPSLGKHEEAAQYYEQALATLTPLLADEKDKSAHYDAAVIHDKIAFALRDVDPRRAMTHASEATELIDRASPDNTTVRAEARIVGADARRNLKDYPGAERLLKEAGPIPRPGTLGQAFLALGWARLEAARGNRVAAEERFGQAIGFAEQLLKKAATPENAYTLAEALEFGAAAIPERAAEWRARKAEVWAEQNRRFPGHRYIEQQVGK